MGNKNFQRIYKLVEHDARCYAINELLSRYSQEYLELKAEYAQKLVQIELAKEDSSTAQQAVSEMLNEDGYIDTLHVGC